MQAVWKKGIEITEYQKIKLPKRAKILCVQMREGAPYIWFINPDIDQKETEQREIKIYRTGYHGSHINGLVYIGTFQTGILGLEAYHVFEK